MLPCANCAALRMDVVLHLDNRGAPSTYEQRMVYVDARGKDQLMKTSGRWLLARAAAGNADASLFKLLPPRPGDQPMLLDNQIASVVPANSIRHYNPVFSINETGWWLHRR